MVKTAFGSFTESEVNYDTQVKPKIDKLKSDLACCVVKNRRFRLLVETDWMANQDRTMTDAERDYRQSLRDMPADNPDATLDENDEVINVTWPTKPE